MKKIYISGCYSGTDYFQIEEHIQLAEKASVELYKRGWNCFTPHKNTAHYERYKDFTYNFWIMCDLDWLVECDAIFMLCNYARSQGAQIELEFALRNDIPVFYEKDGYPEINANSKI